MADYSTKMQYANIYSKELHVDPDYQRELNQRRVQSIVKSFNPALVNPVKVSRRDDGRYFVFDGQHTLAALKERNGGDLQVACKVYEFKHVTDKRRQEIEATLFAEQNGLSAAVHANSRFKARLIAGDPDIIQFQRLTQAAGVRMDFTQGACENKIICCAEAYKAYNALTPSDYVDMLTVICEAWDGEKASFRQEIIGGMAILYKSYAGEFKRETLVKQLSKTSPLRIIRDGANSHESGKRKYTERIIAAYNKGLSRNKIE